MDKQFILSEIKRTAAANGGVPLGRERFARETGIKQSDCVGRWWPRWADALREAGFQPNKMQDAYSEQFLIEKLASLTRELGHFPLFSELRMKERQDDAFPTHSTFSRLGSKAERASKVRAYCEATPGYEGIAVLCAVAPAVHVGEEVEVLDRQEDFGFVYLLISGGYYKIGRSNHAGRRERELALQLPEKATTVHVIRTDDPVGIEAYWHKRFEAKWKNGEWFDLDATDVKAFKRRKFM